MQQRYYDPIAGRFLSTDPVTTDEKTGDLFNRYVYGRNNPYRYTDPDGRLAFLIPVAWAIFEAVTTATVVEVSAAAVGVAGAAIIVNAAGSSGGGKTSTLTPGPNAGDSVPARGPGRDFTPGERQQVNEIGDKTGCHTCGAETPGTKSGNWVPDHQPPSSQNPEGAPQRLYPHCLQCSRTQGGEARQAPKPQPQPQPKPPEPKPEAK
jgi:uncharacterized protein RhaS with RHS repeats